MSNNKRSLNPKSEYRNPKQFSNIQNSNDQNKKRLENLKIRTFGFVSCFGFNKANSIIQGGMMKNLQKKTFLLAICYLLIANLMGCATIIDSAKGIAGISTKALKDGRKDAIKKIFNYNYNTCYNKTKEILTRIGTYIYAKDAKKKMLAIYVSQEDTTPVGVFFKEIDANNTQVEVSSPSTYAKEFIAEKVFKSLSPEEKPEESHAQKN